MGSTDIGTQNLSRSLAATTAVFLAAAAGLSGLAFAGSNLLDTRWVSIPLLLALLASGALALLGWSSARMRTEELEEEHELERSRLEAELVRERERGKAELREAEARAEAERRPLEAAVREAHAEATQLKEERGELETRLREKEEEVTRERRTRARAEQARRDEKEWAQHLRREIVHLQRERGVIGDTSDIRELVLRIAMRLLEAEKGLLLSREDENSDGRLDLVASYGFENDPSDSAVAQRFATRVLERDETIREDDAPDIDRERRTPADDEIENLVAIPIYMLDRFSGVVVCANHPGGFEEFDDEVLLALGDHAGAVLQNARLQGELRNSYVGTVRVLSDAIEAKDRFLRGHAEETSAYVAAVADRLEIEPKRREELLYSSLLHDVGKIGISERILLKPAALTPEERSVVELHPRIGYRLVQQVPALRPTELAILHHHERFDGEGYPAGLRGEEIPVEARIIAVADAFSAMTSDRPYRGRMSYEEACAELERCAGTQFDPVVVRLFVEEVRRRPPGERDGDSLHAALADPELDARKARDEPILGSGSFALTDNLTLLYSHRHLHDAAGREANRATVQGYPFSVVVVELIDLPVINQEHGYAAGDRTIQAVARVVQSAAARRDGTPCRESGRRLALVVRGGEEAAETCVAEIRGELADGPRCRVVFAVWRPGDTGEDVLARARGALVVSGV